MVFEFQLGRGRAGPKRFLEGFEGLLQTDGYIAYEKVGGPKMVHAACWAHSRRGLFEAHELAPGEIVAKEIVEHIDDLFGIDRQARENGYDFVARHRLRAEHAPKLLSTIKAKLQAAQPHALPASKLEKAVAYALGRWPRLEIFLQYPEVELSNNLAENSMRGVAIGRKNWIHIGSPMAGHGSPPSCRSPKAAVASTFQSASISRRFCRGWQTFAFRSSRISRRPPGLRGAAINTSPVCSWSDAYPVTC